MPWQRVAKASDIPDRGAICIRVSNDRIIALFNLSGAFYATDGICTHAHAYLSDGFVEEEIIECPLHQGRFHIPTGKAVGAPAMTDLKTYPAKEEFGEIWVDL